MQSTPGCAQGAPPARPLGRPPGPLRAGEGPRSCAPPPAPPPSQPGGCRGRAPGSAALGALPPRPAPHPRCRPAPPPSTQRRAAQAFIETRSWARLPRWGPAPPGQSEAQPCRPHLPIPMATGSPAVNLLRETAVGRGGDGPPARGVGRAPWWPPRGTAQRRARDQATDFCQLGPEVPGSHSSGGGGEGAPRGFPRRLGSVRWPSWLCVSRTRHDRPGVPRTGTSNHPDTGDSELPGSAGYFYPVVGTGSGIQSTKLLAPRAAAGCTVEPQASLTGVVGGEGQMPVDRHGARGASFGGTT